MVHKEDGIRITVLLLSSRSIFNIVRTALGPRGLASYGRYMHFSQTPVDVRRSFEPLLFDNLVVHFGQPDAEEFHITLHELLKR
jgi:hypothetical protein